MKSLHLLLVFALLAGSSYAGPFGLKAGMDVEEANKVGAARKVNGWDNFVKIKDEIYSHLCKFKIPSETNGKFKFIEALFTKEMGLIAIEVNGDFKAPTQSDDLEALNKAEGEFDEIVKILTAKYGEPSNINKDKWRYRFGTLIATWPTQKREKSVFDLSVELARNDGPKECFYRIRYWFAPESNVMRKIQEEKLAAEAKAKKIFNDL